MDSDLPFGQWLKRRRQGLGEPIGQTRLAQLIEAGGALTLEGAVACALEAEA